MEILDKVVEIYDFNHCVEREGFIFTSIMEPANVLDAIVIRNPEVSKSITPQKSFSKKSLKEHIDFINLYKLEKACVIAEDIKFLLQCPTLKYLQIIPAKTAPDNFDYSPLYDLSKLNYLMAITEYRDHLNPVIANVDYSKINGLKEVRASGKGHINLKKLSQVECLDVSNMKMTDLYGMACYLSLKRLDFLKTGIKSLRGIGEFKQLQWLSLNYERGISDISEIVNVSDTLRVLSIENCSQIKDFSFLEKLVNLEHLKLHGSNKMPNVNFLKEMPKLKTFTFSMEIEDGELKPCLNIPYVWCKKGKKHYNLKDRELPKNDNFEEFKLM